jgi:hypothetical protein
MRLPGFLWLSLWLVERKVKGYHKREEAWYSHEQYMEKLERASYAEKLKKLKKLNLRTRETDMSISTVVRQSKPQSEIKLTDDGSMPDHGYYFYDPPEREGSIYLLVRPGASLRFVNLRRLLDRSSEDARSGSTKHKWSCSVHEAVERAMEQGHEVRWCETFGEMFNHTLKKESWLWR